MYNQYPLFLRARISIDQKDHAHALECLRCVFLILDKAARVNLSAGARKKAEAIRKKVVSQADSVKKEEKDKIIEEKLRKEQQDYLNKLRSLPEAEQRKL